MSTKPADSIDLPTSGTAVVDAPGTSTVPANLAQQSRWRRWSLRLKGWVDRTVSGLVSSAWPGMVIGALAVLIAGQTYIGRYGQVGLGVPIEGPALAFATVLAGAILGLFGLLTLWLIGKLPKELVYALTGIFGSLAVMPYVFLPSFIIGGCLIGGMVSIALVRSARKPLSIILLLTATTTVVGSVLWLASPGTDSHLVKPPTDASVVEELNLPDPSVPGPLQVEYLTYGSGTDRWRREYGPDVSIKTETVDATTLMPGLGAKWKENLRWRYWGFNAKSLPLNARVWHPNGNGPFPLVLIVHGNHQAEEFSDSGYAWLGEHLASHGYIAASVDENFLNGNWAGDYGQQESIVRTWLLFQHLRLWKTWNAQEGSPFKDKVDLSNIALIGHSRGGQAVTSAPALNRLRVHPEKGNYTFDFNYSIKSVISIAPNDPYEPSGSPVPLENVNFMTLSGGHDSDASGFWGLRPYYRTRFTDGQYWCKSAVYLYRGNHGQFNTVWGRHDHQTPAAWMLNTKPLLSGEDQRRAGKAFITAFLDTTLRGKTEYLAFLRDHRRGRKWLPEDIYVTQFEDSNFRRLVDFSEDIDLLTTTVPGGSIRFEGMGQISEYLWFTRDTYSARTPQKVIYLGWDRSDKSKSNGPAPHYSITLPKGLAKEWKLDPQTRLAFFLCNSKREPAEIDLSIALEDESGNRFTQRLSRFAPLHPPLISKISKLPRYWPFGAARDWEQVPQTFELPLAQFHASASTFDPSRLSAIHFVFDQTPSGEVLMGRIGFSIPQAQAAHGGRE